jgi:hypothetical protein
MVRAVVMVQDEWHGEGGGDGCWRVTVTGRESSGCVTISWLNEGPKGASLMTCTLAVSNRAGTTGSECSAQFSNLKMQRWTFVHVVGRREQNPHRVQRHESSSLHTSEIVRVQQILGQSCRCRSVNVIQV